MLDKAKHAYLAQKALDTYLSEHDDLRRWCFLPPSNDIGESDIIDLMTDLLLLEAVMDLSAVRLR